MKPLLEIKTVPISIQYKMTPARLETKHTTAELEISRDTRGLSIKSRPIRLNVDSFEARNSVSPSAMRSIRDAGDRGIQMAYEATGSIAREGTMLVNIHLNEDPIMDILRERNLPPMPEANIKYIPDQPIQMDWVPGEMQIEYEMDKMNFDWTTDRQRFEFVPGSIEIVVEERPQVIIEFVGRPIYVPPSADPEHRFSVDMRI